MKLFKKLFTNFKNVFARIKRAPEKPKYATADQVRRSRAMFNFMAKQWDVLAMHRRKAQAPFFKLPAVVPIPKIPKIPKSIPLPKTPTVIYQGSQPKPPKILQLGYKPKLLLTNTILEVQQIRKDLTKFLSNPQKADYRSMLHYINDIDEKKLLHIKNSLLSKVKHYLIEERKYKTYTSKELNQLEVLLDSVEKRELGRVVGITMTPDDYELTSEDYEQSSDAYIQQQKQIIYEGKIKKIEQSIEEIHEMSLEELKKYVRKKRIEELKERIEELEGMDDDYAIPDEKESMIEELKEKLDDIERETEEDDWYEDEDELRKEAIQYKKEEIQAQKEAEEIKIIKGDNDEGSIWTS